MTARWVGLVRAALVVVAGAGLTYAAGQVAYTTDLSPSSAPSTSPQASLVPVTSTTLTCPGPETTGLQGVPAVAGTTTVYASTAPPAAMTAVTLGSGTGSLGLSIPAGGQALAATAQRGVTVSGTVSGSWVARVDARGLLAPGAAGLQTTVSTEGDDRAAVATPCLTPRAELWIVAGGGGSTRRERIVLANPGANPVSADVTIHGATGLLPSANGQDVAVPPHGRTTLLVDALVGAETSPVVHVVATGGVLTGVVEDSWIDGAVGRGADDAIPAADPANEQVIPAAYLDGAARLRVAATGSAETVVQARLLTKDGPAALPGDGVLRIPAGAVSEVDLGTVPTGAYAIQVRADQPVVAGVQAERRPPGATQTDFGWTTSTAPIGVVAGVPLPDAVAGASVLLVATGEPGTATVFTVSSGGAVDARPYSLAADSVANVDVGGARQVWVGRTTGTVRAGLALSLPASSAGPLFSLVPLNPAPVTASSLPVVQVPR